VASDILSEPDTALPKLGDGLREVPAMGRLMHALPGTCR